MEDSNVFDLLTGKKPEQKTEELKAEEPKAEVEQSTEQPTEELKAEEPRAEEPKAEAEQPKVIEILNKELGTQFGEPSEIKAIFEKANTLETEVKTWQEKYKELEESVSEAQNPLSYFIDENEYKRQQLLKTKPDLNPSEVNNLFTTNLNDLSPEDLMVMNVMLKNPEVNKEEALDHIRKTYDYDPDDKIPASLKIASKDAKKELSELKTSVELPKKVDFETMRKEKIAEQDKLLNKNKSDLEPIVNKLAESMSDLELFDGFKYQIEPEARAEAPSEMLGFLLDSGAKIDDNTEKYLGLARDRFMTDYFVKNHKRIMEAYATQKVAEKDAEWRQKVDNPKSITHQEAPDGKPQDTDVVGMLKK